MVSALYSVVGHPANDIMIVLTLNAELICITAPKSSCGAICGIDMYHTSCQRFRIPSIACLKQGAVQLWKPAIKERNAVPRLAHSWIRIRIPHHGAGVGQPRIGSCRTPMLISI